MWTPLLCVVSTLHCQRALRMPPVEQRDCHFYIATVRFDDLEELKGLTSQQGCGLALREGFLAGFDTLLRRDQSGQDKDSGIAGSARAGTRSGRRDT